ncbi:hypothetical protein QBC42DRAFT_15851 [Cladorrhinum samala]|uniref:Uncharacterized protein n=1 Tax=Cladorrhinum samala TaxID=585594 RepID=A0AAV9HEE7_9PEZI|nr:hypothetical protein QBC42DRAFT_15851 [Cladorrhinum samala]
MLGTHSGHHPDSLHYSGVLIAIFFFRLVCFIWGFHLCLFPYLHFHVFSLDTTKSWRLWTTTPIKGSDNFPSLHQTGTGSGSCACIRRMTNRLFTAFALERMFPNRTTK